jgi:hypothetical protein
MKKEIGLIVILCIMFAGCIGSPPKIKNPLSSAPGMIMDYDENTDTTKIWIRGGATDYKYSNITITISKDETQMVSTDNNTYCLQCNINSTLRSFSMEIVVWAENTCYEYICDVTVHEFETEDEDNPRFTIVDDKHPEGITVLEKDLPFKKTLSEVEE